MYHNFTKAGEKMVYPGEHVPMLTEEELKGYISKNTSAHTFYLPVSIEETENQFRLEVAVPGVKREEFYIRADKNDLSIRVVHPQPQHPVSQKEDTFSDYTCFDQHIILPKNADAEFSCAEYINGLLKLSIHKASSPVHNVHAAIAVY